MTAKSYYTTRLIADRRYTHMISNGDLAPGFFDPATGAATPQNIAGDNERVLLTYFNHNVNMAPYLFFLGVGSYKAFRGEFEYCDGSKHIAELLCFPGLVQDKHARTALQSLIDSIYVSKHMTATRKECRDCFPCLTPFDSPLISSILLFSGAI